MGARNKEMNNPLMHASPSQKDDTGSSSVLDSWSQQEAKNEATSRQEAQQAQLEDEMHPKRRAFHKFMYVIRYIVVVAALNMLIGQIVGMIFENVGVVEYIMRIYVIVLCVLVMCVELEFTKFARESMIFHVWVTRGLFYGFIGVLGLELNDNATARDGVQISDLTRNYLRAVAWIMIGCGGVYLAMGVTCMQILYNKQRKDFEERMGRSSTVRSTVERTSNANNQV